MFERYNFEKKLWTNYANLRSNHPDLDSQVMVDFYNQNSSFIIRNSQNPHPNTAVIIPAYNEQDYLPRTLASLNYALQNDVNTSVFVVDNNSSDATSEIAKVFGTTVIKETKKGVAHARQTGLESIPNSVKYVLTTDADTVIPRSWIQSHLDSLTDQNTVFTYGSVRFIPDQDQDILSTITLKGYKLCACVFHTINNLRGAMVGGGSNSGYKKDIALICGGYNRDYYVGEDVDIMKRLSQYGDVKKVKSSVLTSARRIINKGTLNHGFERFLSNVNNFLGKEPENFKEDRADYR